LTLLTAVRNIRFVARHQSQGGPIVAFPRQHLTLVYCQQIHVGQKHYKENVLLRFHGNAEHFYIVNSYTWVKTGQRTNIVAFL
jgi:hypothetical protein